MNTNIKKTLANDIFISVRQVLLLKYTIKYPKESFLLFAVDAEDAEC